MTYADHSQLVPEAKRRLARGRALSRFEVLALLGQIVRESGSMRAGARFLTVSAPYLHDVLHGRRDPGPKVLRPLGLKARSTTTLEYIPDV